MSWKYEMLKLLFSLVVKLYFHSKYQFLPTMKFWNGLSPRHFKICEFPFDVVDNYNMHLMTGPRETMSFISLEPSILPEAKPRGTLRWREYKTHCFQQSQSLSVLLYLPTKKKLGKFIEFTFSLEEWNDVKYIRNKSHLNCSPILGVKTCDTHRWHTTKKTKKST